jgi:hypothetical protein
MRTSCARDAPGSIAPRERFEAALREAGRGLAPIRMHVCVTDESLTSCAGLNRKTETDDVPVLRVALDLFVEFYRGRAGADGGLIARPCAGPL